MDRASPADDVVARQRQALRVMNDAAREVESLRRAKLRRLDTGAAIVAHDGAYRLARTSRPSRLDSGLVEQQCWFSRAQGRPA
jgi:hypothetical protein